MPSDPQANFYPGPLVSVLVPAYNHAPYIEEALNSIAGSRYSPLEILVMDDGSDDDTYARACSWIRVNGHRVARAEALRQRNQGITRTLNTLVRRAQGEYVTLLASDDGLLVDGIALRVSALEGHPHWLAVFGDCRVIDAAGELQATSALRTLYRANLPALANPRRIRRELILRWSVPGPVLLLRRTAFESGVGVGLYDESLQVEDRDFYLRLLAANALGFIPDQVACYRLHGKNSITSNERRSRISCDVVMAEQRNVQAFTGLDRWLLGIVAARGLARLRAAEEDVWSNRVRVLVLGLLVKTIYLLHLATPVPRFRPNRCGGG